MKIVDLICAPAKTGFYFDDQKSIKSGAHADGFTYVGEPVTEGFTSIRQAGEAISLLLVLEDGQIAHGDCAAVQYSGAGGRDPLFLAKNFIPLIETHIRPQLVGKELDSFKDLADFAENIEVDGKLLHTAIRYGVSQAILDAVAKAKKKTISQVVAEEYGCELATKPLSLFTQSGDSRYDNVDKMIIKQAAVLPHGLINNVETKLGKNGELLEEYVQWLRDRIFALRASSQYEPVLHIDVYGTIGMVFGNENYEAMANYIGVLSRKAEPFLLRIEGPMDMGERDAQMIGLRELTKCIDAKGIRAEIVADEWCNTLEDVKYFADNRAGHMLQIKTPDLGGIQNTIEAVLYSKAKGVGAYQGGTCNETDRSAQVCVAVAMATQPVQILAKPGMGVDEGYMIVYNEMQRLLALHERSKRNEKGI